jgi:hypothetical protein
MRVSVYPGECLCLRTQRVLGHPRR